MGDNKILKNILKWSNILYFVKYIDFIWKYRIKYYIKNNVLLKYFDGVLQIIAHM